LPNVTPAPAVLVISDALGRSGFYEHLSRMFAEAGIAALAPDYFFRVNPLRDAEAETRRARRKDELDEQQVLRDLGSSLDWLAEQAETQGHGLGAIGFCMGGTLSLDLAALWPRLGASATFYGYMVGEPGKALVLPPRPLDIADQMRAPLVGFWGDQDPGYDPEVHAEFERRLEAANVSHSFTVYPGIGHGFMREYLDDESAPGHAVAAESWQSTLAFFREHLVGVSETEAAHAS
jgi:carboxymethylenebutenolidase